MSKVDTEIHVTRKTVKINGETVKLPYRFAGIRIFIDDITDAVAITVIEGNVSVVGNVDSVIVDTGNVKVKGSVNVAKSYTGSVTMKSSIK